MPPHKPLQFYDGQIADLMPTTQVKWPKGTYADIWRGALDLRSLKLDIAGIAEAVDNAPCVVLLNRPRDDGHIILTKGKITSRGEYVALRIGSLLQGIVALAFVRVGARDVPNLVRYRRALLGALSTNPKERAFAVEIALEAMTDQKERELLARSLETILRPRTRAPGPGRPRKHLEPTG